MHALVGAAFLLTLAASPFALPLSAQAQDKPASVALDPSKFVRFVSEGDGGHLDTAITTYKKGDVELILYGAVHIADEACYQELNDRFSTCDVLLYELVGPADYRPSRAADERGTSVVSLLQQALKNSLELSFQLDAIDYSPANFVHADMTPKEFQESMAERGESMLSIMVDMMLAGARQQREREDADEGEAGHDESADGHSTPPELDLVRAFRSGEGRHRLRMMFASQLQEIESLAVGGKDGGTLLEGRNEKCLAVLRRELENNHRRIGIYYGAAHLPHMEQRLVQDMGFERVGQEWLVAWDCKKRPDVKYDRKLVKERARCRTELAALAKSAHEYRLRERPDAVIEVAALAAAQHAGEACYSGPRTDPWGNEYRLRKRRTGNRWEAFSAGQDGELGSDDDLVAQEPGGRGLFGR